MNKPNEQAILEAIKEYNPIKVEINWEWNYRSVDFYDGKVWRWAKLTKIGRVAKDSVRISV